MINYVTASIENLIEYEKLGFRTQPLGEVVAYLECLRDGDQSQESIPLRLNQDNKQRLLAKWNNVKTIARMKNLL